MARMTGAEMTRLIETDIAELHRRLLAEVAEERGEEWVREHRQMLDRQLGFLAATNGWGEAEIEAAVKAAKDYQ